MKQKETAFKEKVRERLKLYRPLIWFTKVQQVTKRGDPDFLICVRGNFLAWELKKDENEVPMTLQTYTLSQIIDAGGTARVVHPKNVDEEFLLLEKLLNIPAASL